MGSGFSYQIIGSHSPTSYGTVGLPNSLWVNTSTGLISGTLTPVGTSTFTVTATNSSGTGSAIVTLTVSSTLGVPSITSAMTATGTVGSSFSYQITASNSPASYSATGLPSGLSVNTGSGLISGTPTAAGTSTVTLNATNSSGTGSAVATLTVNQSQGSGPVVSLSSTSIGFGNQGVGDPDYGSARYSQQHRGHNLEHYQHRRHGHECWRFCGD